MEDGGQGFLQDPPRLGNQYEEDTPLREVLQRLLPEDVLQSIEPDLQRFGWRVVDECTQHGPDFFIIVFILLFYLHNYLVKK
jgi:hypothetical protein